MFLSEVLVVPDCRVISFLDYLMLLALSPHMVKLFQVVGCSELRLEHALLKCRPGRVVPKLRLSTKPSGESQTNGMLNMLQMPWRWKSRALNAEPRFVKLVAFAELRLFRPGSTSTKLFTRFAVSVVLPSLLSCSSSFGAMGARS